MSQHVESTGDTDGTDANQHPALDLKDETPPGLVLVLPEHMSGSEHMRAIAEAICALRARMATRVIRHQEAARKARAERDPLRQAMYRGRVLACAEAAASIDEALVEVFDLWTHYNAQVYRARNNMPLLPFERQSTADEPSASSTATTTQCREPDDGQFTQHT